MVNGRLHGEQVVASALLFDRDLASNAMWLFADHSSFSQIKKF
jgi:hypothetical protein